MAATLADEIDALTAERERKERDHPGCFWGDGSMSLSPAEAAVFAIVYEDYLRMEAVWLAWLFFLDQVTMADVTPFSPEALARERALRPELTGSMSYDSFKAFATQLGRLSERQAEAIFWKESFVLVREGATIYADEPR